MFILDTSTSIEKEFYAEKNFALDLIKVLPEADFSVSARDASSYVPESSTFRTASLSHSRDSTPMLRCTSPSPQDVHATTFSTMWNASCIPAGRPPLFRAPKLH